MNLHNNIKLFSDTVRAASQHLEIKLEFVEKDYWISLALYNLAGSAFVSETVFKGGTSLSKGYNLIERFSEDVDLAVVNNGHKSGSEIRTIIRNVEKTITRQLTELPTVGVTSKGSRFRKSVFEYPIIDKNSTSNKLIIEINSFANPFPYQELTIQSMVYDFLKQSGNEKYITQYSLNPFQINVLNKEQTLIEKIVSLLRFSYSENIVNSLRGKIRHFYDLFFLMNNAECIKFVASESFKEKFNSVLQHDREIFDEPKGWQVKNLEESPLLSNFPSLWEQLKGYYQTELTALAYRPIPNEKDIATCFTVLTTRIK